MQSQFSQQPLRHRISQSRPKQRGHMAVWMFGPLVCRHQGVKGEERLSSGAFISSNGLLSKSQLLLHCDQRIADHRGLFELCCSSLQPLHRRPSLRPRTKAFKSFYLHYLWKCLYSVTPFYASSHILLASLIDSMQTGKRQSPRYQGCGQ